MEDDLPETFIWALNSDEIYKKFETHPKFGLSEPLVKQRLTDDGFNQIPIPDKSFIQTYVAPLFNWLIVLYLIAAAIMLIAGSVTGSLNIIVIFSLGMVGLNIVVSIFQQMRAQKKMKSLRELSAPTTNVIRNGEIHEILSKNVVKGDLLILEAGDRTPADARIMKSSNLYVNEASLTGESEPVHKNHGEALDNKPYQLQNRDNILFFGTFLTIGKCQAIVYATGADTEIGQISKHMAEATTSEIPIRKKLDNMGKIFGIGILILWVITIGIIYLNEGFIDRELLILSLEAIMNMLPVNVPIVITIIMLTGVGAMAEHGVIIRNITSVDSLGRVSAICTDKTGTLTKSQMCVQYIWSRGSQFHATGSGYDPNGDISLIDRPQQRDKVTDIDQFPHLKLLLTNAYLNNNAVLKKYQFEITKKRKKRMISDWKIIGSATEGSLLTLVKKSGISRLNNHDLKEEYEELHEYSFSSEEKCMSKIFRHKETGEINVFTKGASERLIMSCDKLLSENNLSVEFATEIKLVLMNTIYNYAIRGYRMLSFAYKKLDTLPDNLEELRQEMESEQIYIGFVAIMDPPRDDVQQAIKECNAAGVKVVMITGDALPTAKAIAKQVGIINGKPPILEGNNLENLINNAPHEELAEAIEKTLIFSRVLPKQKEIIVKTLQENRTVVAMTGDGVNDALALNMADAGVAMGIQGTDVAKEAADMIISDDSFGSIVDGIRRGRGIYANIRSIAFFYICINIWEGMIKLFIPIIFGLPYFHNPPEFFYSWLLISQLIHTWPAFILTFDTIPDEVMHEKPRNSQEIMSKAFLFLLGSYGLLLVSALVGTYFLGYSGTYGVRHWNTNFGSWDKYYLFTGATQSLWQGVDLQIAKTLTMVLVTIFITEFTMILQIRRPNKSLFRSLKEDMNKHIIIQFILIFGVLLGLIYIPGLQVWMHSFGLELRLMFLTFLDWVIILIFSSVVIVGFEGFKKFAREHDIIF